MPSNKNIGNIKTSVSNFSRPNKVTRAQDMSVTKLQQHVERGKAAVSSSQAAQKKEGKRYAKTSIGRVGSFSEATSSIAHAKESDRSIKKHGYESLYGEDADTRRYEYIRRKIRARLAKERKRGEKFFKDLVYKTTKQSIADAKPNYRDRIKMKVDIDKAKQRGTINNEMAETFKSKIDKMA
ncbi:MAG: hypothetical protein GF349_01030 [Candidatus Magasanikbacteria bacterium]|nr:hypothetical protein [Candidatus Magasanikbacteria bacterium]